MIKRIIITPLILWLVVLGTVEAITIEQAIDEHMRSLYDLDPASFDIEVVSHSLTTTEVQPGEFSLRPLTERQPLGQYSIQAEIIRDGKLVESDQIRLKIRKYAKVLVSLDRLKRWDMPQVDQFESKRMEVTNLRERAIANVDQLNGLRLKRNLRKGDILTTAALEPIPDLESGTEVTIVYDDGQFSVAVAGHAMQTGSAGEYIKVKNKASNKVIVARVVDGSSVAVDP